MASSRSGKATDGLATARHLTPYAARSAFPHPMRTTPAVHTHRIRAASPSLSTALQSRRRAQIRTWRGHKACRPAASCRARNPFSESLLAGNGHPWNSGAPGLNPRLELSQTETSSFIGIVIALYRVRKASELLRLDLRKELDVQGALAVSIEPPLAWWLNQLFVGRAEQSPEFVHALSDELHRRLVRRSRGRRIGSRIGCGWRRFYGTGFGAFDKRCRRRFRGVRLGAFDGRCLSPGGRPRGRHVPALRCGWRGEGTGKVVSHRAGLLTSPRGQQRKTHRNTQDRSDRHSAFHRSSARKGLR